MTNHVNINDINFKTGDLILLDGRDPYDESCFMECISDVIEFLTGSKYSHVAMVLKDPTFLEGGPRTGLFIIESGVENTTDVEDNKIKFGVQVQELDTALNSWEGTIYYRSLNCIQTEFESALTRAHETVHNDLYDLIIGDWIRSGFNCTTNFQKSHRTRTFWCSALVAYLYAQMGLLDENIPWSNIRPKDFGTENDGINNLCGCFPCCKASRLEFVNSSLDKEIKLT
jgi:hypothetical protein